MYISIVGYGKMGHLVEETANQRGIQVVSTIDPSGSAMYTSISPESVENADVCICFTQPHSILETIAQLTELKKDIVVGTTGWEDQLEDAKALVQRAGTGMVHSPNFALGVNLFFKMVEMCASIINKFQDYDVAIHEMHHRGKGDSPSGTAISLGNILLSQLNRKRSVLTHRLDEVIPSEAIHISSTRSGHVPGKHFVIFDSEVDTIELIHTARARKGFAVGAVTAAEWIHKKKGCYSKEDLIREMLDLTIPDPKGKDG